MFDAGWHQPMCIVLSPQIGQLNNRDRSSFKGGCSNLIWGMKNLIITYDNLSCLVVCPVKFKELRRCLYFTLTPPYSSGLCHPSEDNITPVVSHGCRVDDIIHRCLRQCVCVATLKARRVELKRDWLAEAPVKHTVYAPHILHLFLRISIEFKKQLHRIKKYIHIFVQKFEWTVMILFKIFRQFLVICGNAVLSDLIENQNYFVSGPNGLEWFHNGVCVFCRTIICVKSEKKKINHYCYKLFVPSLQTCCAVKVVFHSESGC